MLWPRLSWREEAGELGQAVKPACSCFLDLRSSPGSARGVKPFVDRLHHHRFRGPTRRSHSLKPLGGKLASELGLPQEVGSASPRVAVDSRADTQVGKRTGATCRRDSRLAKSGIDTASDNGYVKHSSRTGKLPRNANASDGPGPPSDSSETNKPRGMAC